MTGPRTTPPLALTIAGSDSSGGAGIQADLKTFTVLGVYGASALTAITAQNTRGVQHAELLDPALVTAQIDSVASDLPIAAAKTGMLATAPLIEAVAIAIERHHLAPLVVDPVMVAKSGDPLIADDAVAALASRLLPLARITTPNRHEAARLLGLDQPIETIDHAQDAARQIITRFGPAACIVKGIATTDAQGIAVSADVVCDGEDAWTLSLPRLPGTHSHGSGCTFSAALTAALTRRQPLRTAIHAARRFVHHAMRHAPDLGGGIHPTSAIAWLTRNE